MSRVLPKMILPRAAVLLLTGGLLLAALIAPARAQNAAPPEADGRGEMDLVLIHGLGSSSEVWERMEPYLLGTFRVHRFELSGHGNSATVEQPTIAAELVRLDDFLNEHDLINPILLGHGMGGMIALSYALDHPADVKRLILMDATPKQLIDQETKKKITEQMLDDYGRFVASRFLNMSPVQEVTDQIVDQALRTDSATFVSLLMSSFDYDETKRLRGLSVPMLVIGSEMMFPTAERSRAVLDAVGFTAAPSLSFKRMGRTGHYMMLEQPVYLASVVVSYGLTGAKIFQTD